MSQKIVEKAVDRIVRALDAALAPPVPPSPEAAMAAILKAVIGKTQICDPAVKKQLVELDQKWADRYEVLCHSGYADAKREFATEQIRQQKLFESGDFKNENFWQLSDIVEDLQMRGAAARREMALIGIQACTIAKPVCASVSRLLNEAADEVEATDRAQHEHYAVAFAGSPLSARLRQLGATVMARVSNSGGSRPSHFAPFIL